METDYEKYIRDRISQLRIQKGVSEYQMSFDLGHSRGYINNITSKKAMPSMKLFLSICEYFEITPVDFFDGNIKNPELINKAVDGLKKLNDGDILLVLSFIDRLVNSESNS